jgi:acetyl-CoA C-acetyltransferase
MTNQAFICDAVRTPFGRYGGSLSSVRTDDLGAVPLRALMERNKNVDWQAVSDVLYGCANQAGEDNRNVARMSALLAGLPLELGGATINRLCGSGLDAVGTAARAIRAGEAGLMIAGGVESMSRAPFVMPKAALRQQAHEGAVRRRLHARDGRERGHRLQDRARGARPDGAQLAAARRGLAEVGLLRC